jgi:nicotinamidase-related amidase
MAYGGDPRPHDWLIEEQEYRRHERRRGRRFAFETLNPSRTSLVVIDMVPLFVVQSPFCRAIVPNINRLATALRDRGGTVVWVVPGHRPVSRADEEFVGPAARLLDAELPTAGRPTLTIKERLWTNVAAETRDLFVEKTASSAFFPGRCEVPSVLQARSIDTVIIAGAFTDVCCESSARDASTLGYRVIMVGDANAARSNRDHNAALRAVYREFGDVRSTADVLGLLEPRADGVCRSKQRRDGGGKGARRLS